MVAADLAVERADHGAVGPQQPDQHVLHDAAPVRVARRVRGGPRPTLSRQRARSAPSSVLAMPAAGGSARTTSTAEPGSDAAGAPGRGGGAGASRGCGPRRCPPPCSRPSRPAGRRRPASRASSSRCTTRAAPPARRPDSRCAGRHRCRATGESAASTGTVMSGPAQTARLLRPLRRREERMARPARVRMRRRNPCTLWRRRLFGW